MLAYNQSTHIRKLGCDEWHCLKVYRLQLSSESLNMTLINSEDIIASMITQGFHMFSCPTSVSFDSDLVKIHWGKSSPFIKNSICIRTQHLVRILVARFQPGNQCCQKEILRLQVYFCLEWRWNVCWGEWVFCRFWDFRAILSDLFCYMKHSWHFAHHVSSRKQMRSQIPSTVVCLLRGRWPSLSVTQALAHVLSQS